MGKISNIGGYCVLRLKSEKRKKLSTCIFNPKKRTEFEQLQTEFKTLENMEETYHVLYETSIYPETLQETKHKQNIVGGLTNISDKAYEFFVLLESTS